MRGNAGHWVRTQPSHTPWLTDEGRAGLNLEVDGVPALLSPYGCDRDSCAHLQALAAKESHEPVTDRRIFRGHDAGERFEHRDAHTEPCEHLCKLEPGNVIDPRRSRMADPRESRAPGVPSGQRKPAAPERAAHAHAQARRIAVFAPRAGERGEK